MDEQYSSMNHFGQEYPEDKFSKVWQRVKAVGKRGLKYIACILISALIGASIIHYVDAKKYWELEQSMATTAQENADLKALAWESRNIRITTIQIQEQLSPIGELATYEKEYMGTRTIDTPRDFPWGGEIPGTTNTVVITYSGIVKVGYDVDEITDSIQVDNDNNKIFITLPEPRTLESHIYQDGLQIEEKNNILNPISAQAVARHIADIEHEEKQDAIEEGIYEKARTQVESLIRGLLAKFEDYEVVFIT